MISIVKIGQQTQANETKIDPPSLSHTQMKRKVDPALFLLYSNSKYEKTQ